MLVDNTIEGNSWGSSGGGISLNAAGTPTIARNVVRSNYAGSQGGAIFAVNDSRARIENNLFVDNAAQEGGGVYASAPTGWDVVNNTFVANRSTIARAGSAYFSIGFHAGTRFANNVVVGSAGEALIHCDATYTSSPPVVLNNDVFNEAGGPSYSGSCAGMDGINGNIGADPLFIDVAGGDYHLSSSSPAVDAGTNAAAPAADLDGNPRPLDGDGDGAAVTDTGAYELVPTAPPIPSCDGVAATIYVGSDGRVVGGPGNGQVYQGVITGTTRPDVIVGTEANDRITTRAGNDVVCSRGGQDEVETAAGDDRIFGEAGNDTMKGGADNDTITGGLNADKFRGGAGTDTATDFNAAEGDTKTGVEVS